MGRRSEQTFLCRGHSGGQQAHEKMLNIANHQGNTNQNHSKSTSHLSAWLVSKRTQTTNVSKDVGKRVPLHTVGGHVNWCSHCGKQYGGFSKN